jgi:signal transduction histidine kinase
LLSKLEDRTTPKQLAALVGETLNDGVRPLSWEIESKPDEAIDLSKVKPNKFTLRERFAFKVEVSRATSVASATLLLAIYDLPLIFFVFGLEAVPLGLLAIAVCAAGILLFNRIFRDYKIFSWVAVILVALIAGLLGSSFLFARLLAGGLSPEFFEVGVVFSFAQIYLAVTWFTTTLELRAFSIARLQELNQQMRVLVSTLRQSAWLQKQKLARIVHGPVQSSLFAVYLELNQAETLDENARKQLAEKVGSASQSLDAGNGDLKLPFAAALTQLTEGWGESLEFKVQVNAETAKSIDASEVGKACAIEVLREAINNAAKYGTGRVDISVDSAAEGLVRIQVLNPIAAKTSPATPGYGSTVLDQVTHQWGLKTENDQAVFTALVALAK